MFLICLQASPHEQMIEWDINRTFTGHEYFRARDGEGQDNLSKICRVVDMIM